MTKTELLNKRFGLVAPLRFSAADKVQILRTGKWDFEDYGEVEITNDDIKEFVSNFKSNVRRQDLSINIEHNHDLGAIGWVKDVVASDDFSAAYMVPEWTPKGQDLVRDGAFRYTSPEFYRQWHDPEKDQDHTNVLTAVAVTNFPRLKEMAVIAASEDGTATTLSMKALRLDDGDPHAPVAMSDATTQLVTLMTDTIRSLRGHQVDEEEKKRLAALEAAKKTAPPNDTVTAFAEMQTRVNAAEQRANEATTKMAEMERQMAETRQLLAVEQKSRVTLECREQIDAAKRQGRITPAQAEEYMKKLPDLGVDDRTWWFADLANRPVVVPLTEMGSGEEGTIDPDDTSRAGLAKLAEDIQRKAGKKGQDMTPREALLAAGRRMAEKGAR